MLLFIATTACIHVSAGVIGDDVNGRDVERKIDDSIATYLHSADAGLSIASSECPDHIDVSNGKVAHCSLKINGVDIPVRVAFGGAPQQFKVSLEGSVFDMRVVERYVDGRLKKDYQLQVAARCGDPAVRLYRAGSNFNCEVTGSSKISSVRLKAMENGLLFLYNPAGLSSTTSDRWMVDVLGQHKRGEPVIVSGSHAADFLDGMIADKRSAAPMPGAVIGRAQCPDSLILTGQERGMCFVLFNGQKVRYEAWIDDAVGFRMRNLDVPIDRQHVQQMAQDDLNRRLQENGNVPDAKVDCGTGLLVVQPPGAFYCKLSGNGLSGRLRVNVLDAAGTINWQGVDMTKP